MKLCNIVVENAYVNMKDNLVWTWTCLLVGNYFSAPRFRTARKNGEKIINNPKLLHCPHFPVIRINGNTEERFLDGCLLRDYFTSCLINSILCTDVSSKFDLLILKEERAPLNFDRFLEVNLNLQELILNTWKLQYRWMLKVAQI